MNPGPIPGSDPVPPMSRRDARRQRRDERRRARALDRDHGRRDGAVTAGAWLIALGLVFLVKDLADLDWPEAWPLFVIAAGGASLASALLGHRRRPVGAWSLVWPIAWMLVGGALLASTTGKLGVPPGELVSRWWPVVFVGIGVWFLVAAFWPRGGGAEPAEDLVLPLAGAPEAEVRLQFGAGELRVARAAPGNLVDGRFEGGVVYRSPGPGLVELRPDSASGWPVSGQPLRWSVGLTGEVPLDLRLDTGASKAMVDLIDLRLRLLEIRSGAAETRVRLPGNAGQTWVRTETGVASLWLDIPPGVAARIRSRMALGRTSVDAARFLRFAEGWQSPDFERNPNRVDIEIQGGVGQVTIR
ncbi:MAG: hypothetical protein U0869_08655 [Chloroflexota bacterium]